MKKSVILVALVAVVLSAYNVAAPVFPKVTCTNLKDKQVVLPTDYAGKRTVVALMLSTKADKQMQKWAQPLYNALVADAAGGLMGGSIYNANLCFVGAVKGLAKLALPELIKKAKQEVNGKYHANFMYTDTDVNALMQSLSITDKDIPHFIVLESDGTVLHKESGEFNDDKLNEITGALLN